jgi:hypothetical protein
LRPCDTCACLERTSECERSRSLTRKDDQPHASTKPVDSHRGALSPQAATPPNLRRIARAHTERFTRKPNADGHVARVHEACRLTPHEHNNYRPPNHQHSLRLRKGAVSINDYYIESTHSFKASITKTNSSPFFHPLFDHQFSYRVRSLIHSYIQHVHAQPQKSADIHSHQDAQK